MAIIRAMLSISDQLKLGLLSKADQAAVLNCRTVDEASRMLNNTRTEVRLEAGTYEPKLQVSGSSIKYKTKNLFTESFDETDVEYFIALAEMSQNMPEEVIEGELKRKIRLMRDEGTQPLQCMVYATKNNEKVFYSNDKKVTVWAKIIAEQVNFSSDNALSINHMLVNWGMWKYQIRLLIEACSYIKENESLDEVIRDMYTDHKDDKVRYTVLKRLLHGGNLENFKSAFQMIKNADFIGSDTDRKYFNALKRKVENASADECKSLYAAFRETQGIKGARRKRIDALFGHAPELKIAERINNADPEEKAEVLKEVHQMIYGTQKDYKDVAMQSREIHQFRNEIQDMFIDKLSRTYTNIEDAKTYGLAIIDLDTNGRAIPFLEKQLAECLDPAKQVIYAYLLAVASDSYINNFVAHVLKYSGNNTHALLNSVRNLSRQGKNMVTRQFLYSNCIRIKDGYGFHSIQFETALRNMGEFLQGGHTVAIYDIKFDQLLFDFLGYDKIAREFKPALCTSRNATLVLGILENVMDKNNYEGRYMSFTQSLYKFFKNTDINISERINNTVKELNGSGIPDAEGVN